jgi:hypothetical protein
MIFNFLKHLIMALLLDAGAALAFGVDDKATTTAAPQSCTLPAATVTSGASQPSTDLPDTGTRS